MLIEPNINPISGTISATKLDRLAAVLEKPANPVTPIPQKPAKLKTMAKPAKRVANKTNQR
jgi:hypothetical protein